ncbi:MAG: hypothetical protein N2652_03165 [Kiritimatiellae bacterium]|nr:hypothetical protein [Kiritimatiellia bacterium]
MNAVAFVALVAAAFAAARVAAGERVRELAVPGARDPVVVYVPDGRPPTPGWPAVFFYHGMNGRPTVAPLLAQPAASNALLIGMAYAQPEAVARSRAEHEAWLAAERALLAEVRRRVAALAPLAPAALYLGGVSMGGWTAAALHDRRPADHAGLIVLLAGRRSGDPSPPAGAFKGQRVYLGAGEHDPNLAAARRAAAYYRLLGASVTFEMYLGEGHEVPDSAPRLNAWLAAEFLYRQHGGEGVHPEVAAWWADARRALAAEADPQRSAQLVEAIREDPRFGLCGVAAEVELRQVARALERNPWVRDRWRAEDELERWLAAEWAAVSLDAFRAVRDGLSALAQHYPGAPATRFAVIEREALDRLLAQSRTVSVTSAPARAPTPLLRLPGAPPRDRRVPPLRRR